MKLAIQGHETRGKEVIQLLEMLGGVNIHNYVGTTNEYYAIDNNKICTIYISVAKIDNCVTFTLEDFEEKFPYKVGDKVTLDKSPCIITGMSWYCDDVIYYVKGDGFSKGVCSTDKDLQPYEEETNMETDCKNCGLHYGSVRCFDMDYCPNNKPKSYAVGLKDGKVIECGVNMKDNKTTDSRIDFSLTERVELDLGDTHEVVVENGKTYVVKKKPTYPKTYEECCEVLGISRHDVEIDLPQPYQQKMFNLFKLHICRDAYWRLYGEEKGLGKSWKPDWREKRYIIYRNQDNIIGGCREAGFVEHHIFEFPIREMRDTFKENFNEEIEMCKELL